MPGDGGGRVLRFTADRAGSASWHLQLYRNHLPLAEGESYHLGFRVRAPAGVVGPAGPVPPARDLEILAMLGVPDWRNIGLWRSIHLSPEWQRIDVTFRPERTVAGEGRLNFSLHNHPGVLELADVSLTAGAPPIKLGAGETLEQGTIPTVPGESGSPAGEDFLRFLADTDRATAHTLATFIRQELGLKSLLVDTQASYGGLEGLRRELQTSDFVDMHAYWQHPDFAAGWSKLRFHIENTTQAAAAEGGALGSLAVYRVAGRPFTVSEYNVPTPNDYASEALPMYAAVAALQDWDAIYAYTYLDFSTAWDADHLLGFFDLGGNPGALSFLPVAALAFRDALIRARAGGGPAGAAGQDGRARAAGRRARAGAALEPRRPPARLDRLAPAGGRAGGCAAGGRTSPAAPSQVEWNPAHATFTVDAPAVRAAAGRIAGTTVAVGDVAFTVGELPRGDAAIALAALDGRPVSESKSLLLVAAARVENSAMAFNAERTGLTSWGHGPAVAEFVPLTVTLPGTFAHAIGWTRPARRQPPFRWRPTIRAARCSGSITSPRSGSCCVVKRRGASGRAVRRSADSQSRSRGARRAPPARPPTDGAATAGGGARAACARKPARPPSRPRRPDGSR